MPTSVRLPKDAEERLNHLSKVTGRPKSFYIKQAILEYLDDLEDAYLRDKVLKRIKRGKERTYSLEEVVEDLELED